MTMKIPTLYHPSYYQPEAASWLSTRKVKDVFEACTAEGLIVTPASVMSEGNEDLPDAWEMIASVHDPKYVEAVRTGVPVSLAQSQGFTWSRAWADSVARIWYNHVMAAVLARRTGIAFHPVSGAHHAEYGSGMGFCTFNYLIGAAAAILAAWDAKKVLIVDLDTHQGNGQDDLVRHHKLRKSIVEFDISGAGFGVELGDDLKAGRFYALARTREQYFDALSRLPAYLDAHKPDLVLFQAGMDCFEGDVMGGVPGMNGQALGIRDESVFAWCRLRDIPVVFNLAGGYVAEGNATVNLHVETVRRAARVYNLGQRAVV